MNDAIMALLKIGFWFFIGVCFFLWAFQPGHTWVYFVIFAFIGAGLVYWVTKSHPMWLLALLLIGGLYFWKYASIDNAIQWAGRQLPQKAVKQGAKNAEQYAKSKVPGADVAGAVQISSRLSQSQINQCLRDTITKYSKTDTIVARNAQQCAQKTGTDYEACMMKYAFNADAPEAAVIDAVGCTGVDNTSGAALHQNVDDLKLGPVGIAVCDVKEFVNYFPWVNFDTTGCPQ